MRNSGSMEGHILRYEMKAQRTVSRYSASVDFHYIHVKVIRKSIGRSEREQGCHTSSTIPSRSEGLTLPERDRYGSSWYRSFIWTGLDVHLHALQQLAAHVKLLIDAPENLWRLIERKKYFPATWLFLLVRVVHRALLRDTEREGIWQHRGIDVPVSQAFIDSKERITTADY